MRDTNERAVQAMREFLEALGIDLAARGMEKTPERVAKMYASLFDGLGHDTKSLWGELFHTGADGLVAVRHIPFYSMCEHHLVPFFGEVNVVYLLTRDRSLVSASLSSLWNAWRISRSSRNA